MKPTAKQIKAEIKTLRKMKPTVIQFSRFGDDNHKAIDAQISVLETNMEEEKVYSTYEDNRYSANSAIDAIAWRDDQQGDEYAAPSDEWKALVKE